MLEYWLNITLALDVASRMTSFNQSECNIAGQSSLSQLFVVFKHIESTILDIQFVLFGLIRNISKTLWQTPCSSLEAGNHSL